MKKTYMVKKNPNLPTSADNWIFMNSYEFAMFMKTEEGQKRKKNFGQIDACGEEDDIIIAECGEECAKEWRAEKDAHDYLKECEAESGIETVSFCAVNDDGEKVNLEEMIADSESDVFEDVLKTATHEALMVALGKLSDKDYKAIYYLYLSENPMTEEEYAMICGCTQQAIHFRKKEALKKLKKYF